MAGRHDESNRFRFLQSAWAFARGRKTAFSWQVWLGVLAVVVVAGYYFVTSYSDDPHSYVMDSLADSCDVNKSDLTVDTTRTKDPRSYNEGRSYPDLIGEIDYFVTDNKGGEYEAVFELVPATGKILTEDPWYLGCANGKKFPSADACYERVNNMVEMTRGHMDFFNVSRPEAERTSHVNTILSPDEIAIYNEVFPAGNDYQTVLERCDDL